MTDTAARAEQRWALAVTQARTVLAAGAPRLVPTPLVIGAVAVVLAALALGVVVFPGDTAGRQVIVVVVVCLGCGAVAGDLVAVVVRRRRPEGAPVVATLTQRERSAVRRVIDGRAVAPEDRLDVIRAAAAQSASGADLVSGSGQLVVFTALAASSTATAPFMAVVAAIRLVPLVVLLCQVAAARRYLDGGTRSGSGTVPSGSIESGA